MSVFYDIFPLFFELSTMAPKNGQTGTAQTVVEMIMSYVGEENEEDIERSTDLSDELKVTKNKGMSLYL